MHNKLLLAYHRLQTTELEFKVETRRIQPSKSEPEDGDNRREQLLV